jgi:glycosyltransferase involved in cell wall biosynthesis
MLDLPGETAGFQAMGAPLPVVHVYQTLLESGGVETLLGIHRRLDEAAGLAPQFRMLFERRPPPGDPLYHNWNFRWFHTLAVVRRDFGRVMAQSRGAVVIHHSCWGTPFLAAADASGRRLIFLHNAGERHLQGFLGAQRGYVDGVLSISPVAGGLVSRLLPEIEPDRFCAPAAPISLPAVLPERRLWREGDPVVLGYSGRLWRSQKRLDRVVPLVAALREAGVNFRLELLGDGPYRPVLERRLAGCREVKFCGWRTHDAYWRTLAGWDGICFFSDYEGGPLTLVEAMAVGTLPFFPQIGGSLGDYYTPQVNGPGYYPAGDVGALARAIQGVFGQDRRAIEAQRARARELVRNHTIETYERDFAGFVQRMAARPRLSREPVASPPARLAHCLPLGLVTRFWPGLLRQA